MPLIGRFKIGEHSSGFIGPQKNQLINEIPVGENRKINYVIDYFIELSE